MLLALVFVTPNAPDSAVQQPSEVDSFVAGSIVSSSSINSGFYVISF